MGALFQDRLAKVKLSLNLIKQHTIRINGEVEV
jgi:hypothetical protein